MPIGLDWNHCHPRIYLPGPAPGAGRYCSGDAEGGRRAAYAAGLTGDGRKRTHRADPRRHTRAVCPGTESPFAVCDIWVEVPGYEMLLVENVQVFPNTETLQELELIPLPEQTSSSTRGEIVDIPPQDL